MLKSRMENGFNLDTGFYPGATLDFHGRGTLYPNDVEKLLGEFIEDAIVAGTNQVLIVTGKGEMVRPLVEKLLMSDNRVGRYRYAGYFNGQSGAFEVTLME